METRRRTPDGNKDGSEDSSGDGNRDEDRIGEGGREAKKHKKPQNSCRRHVGNGRHLGGKRKKCRKERVGPPVAANPDNLESNKEAGGGGGTRYSGLKLKSVQVERVRPLCRV